jgi:hypothetical protein
MLEIIAIHHIAERFDTRELLEKVMKRLTKLGEDRVKREGPPMLNGFTAAGEREKLIWEELVLGLIVLIMDRMKFEKKK